MTLMIVSLLAGCLLGASNKLPEKYAGYMDKLITATLFIMLFAVGAQIGGDAELIVNLPVLGGKALVIAALAVCGSVAALWLISRKFDFVQKERGALGHGESGCRQ